MSHFFMGKLGPKLGPIAFSSLFQFAISAFLLHQAMRAIVCLRTLLEVNGECEGDKLGDDDVGSILTYSTYVHLELWVWSIRPHLATSRPSHGTF